MHSCSKNWKKKNGKIISTNLIYYSAVLFGGSKEMCHYLRPVYLFTRWNEMRMKKIRRNNRAHDELVLWLKFVSRNATRFYEWLLIGYNLDATTLKPNYPHSLLSIFQRIVRTYFVCLYPPVHTWTHEWLHSRLECIRIIFFKLKRNMRDCQSVNATTTTRWIIKIQHAKHWIYSRFGTCAKRQSSTETNYSQNFDLESGAIDSGTMH